MNLIILLKFAERKALGQFNDLAIVTLSTQRSEMASPDLAEAALGIFFFPPWPGSVQATASLTCSYISLGHLFRSLC